MRHSAHKSLLHHHRHTHRNVYFVIVQNVSERELCEGGGVILAIFFNGIDGTCAQHRHRLMLTFIRTHPTVMHTHVRIHTPFMLRNRMRHSAHKSLLHHHRHTNRNVYFVIVQNVSERELCEGGGVMLAIF